MLTYKKILDAVQEIAPIYNIDQIYLFGSYARGDATDESDCDLRVVGGSIDDLYDFSAVYSEFEDRLGTKIDLAITKNTSKAMLDRIREHELLVFDCGRTEVAQGFLDKEFKTMEKGGLAGMTLINKNRHKLEKIIKCCNDIQLITEKFNRSYEVFINGSGVKTASDEPRGIFSSGKDNICGNALCITQYVGRRMTEKDPWGGGRAFDTRAKNEFLYQQACAMSFIQIGELATRLPEQFRQSYNGVPWGKIRGMRNIFVNEYENVDFSIVWEYIERDIPALKNYCSSLLKSGNEEVPKE